MRKLSVLGSTGFIGMRTLALAAQFPRRFKVVGLAAGRNIERLCRQVEEFRPEVVAVSDRSLAQKLKAMLPKGRSMSIRHDTVGMVEVATHPDAELVVSAVVGAVGLVPTYAAIQAGKRVALANKETLIAAGRMVMEAAHACGSEIIPVDSEHSAIFQSLKGHRRGELKRIILTASGGPFFHSDPHAFASITPEEALQHPVWQMGNKITIDSATMMNKALEVIEARWLFDVLPEAIDVVIHPQSIVHSMVEYRDGSVIAQMSVPDMRIPIAYALTYPQRLTQPLLPALRLAEVGALTFLAPKHDRFPAIRLAYQALREGETMCTVLNGANEKAVEAFLQKRIRFADIPVVVERAMQAHQARRLLDINESLKIDSWARRKATEVIKRLKSG